MKLENGKVYRLVSLAGQLAVAAENDSTQDGAMIKLTANLDAPSAKWMVESSDDGWFKLVNQHTGKVLDTVASGVEAGTWVHQWSNAGSQDQEWSLLDCEDYVVMLISRKSGRCLDIAQMASVEGAQLQIWDNLDGDNQKWIVQELEAVPQKRKRRTKAEIEADKAAAPSPKKRGRPKAQVESDKAVAENLSAEAAADQPKKRKRRTKAEIEADKKKEAKAAAKRAKLEGTTEKSDVPAAPKRTRRKSEPKA